MINDFIKIKKGDLKTIVITLIMIVLIVEVQTHLIGLIF